MPRGLPRSTFVKSETFFEHGCFGALVLEVDIVCVSLLLLHCSRSVEVTRTLTGYIHRCLHRYLGCFKVIGKMRRISSMPASAEASQLRIVASFVTAGAGRNRAKSIPVDLSADCTLSIRLSQNGGRIHF